MNNLHQISGNIAITLLAFLLIMPGYSLKSQETNASDILMIATSQFPVSSDIEENAVWIKRHMFQAKTQNVDLVHFPECALSGYAGVDFKSLDELDWPKLQKHTQTILDLADELDNDINK